MIIYGTKSIENVVKSGKFHCPNCKREQNYRLKRYKRYFHLFFIPLFSTADLGDELECCYCHTSYVPGSILNEDEYTPQNPHGTVNATNPIGLTAANTGKRVGAFVIDVILIYILYSIFSSFNFWFFIEILAFIYFVACDILLKGSSLGKLILSMKVSDYEDDNMLTIPKVIIRNVIKTLSGFLPLLYLLAFLNEDRQALHDKAINSIVIDRIN